ncbi:hypothetical protein EB796_014206 [Bugula neritina]|uniref:EF-hand domain-containing protein n=1 Tax=Bugula neritina TaxID=10212 RepID=A0A7J7JPD2_BUGNE|nr:hypothetical protein EB796_014206 [Bugula neritina]
MFTEDGMYDKDEFVFLIYLKWNEQESMEDIKEAFMVFDKVLATAGTYNCCLYMAGYTFVYCNVAQTHDNNGTLSKEEFSYILSKLGEPLTEEEVDEILRCFDKDGNGEIDFDVVKGCNDNTGIKQNQHEITLETELLEGEDCYRTTSN